MSFHFSKPIETVKASTKVHILSSGICHGIILWIDWVLHAESEERVSTGPEGHEPSHWKQGVKLFRSPVQVESFLSKDASLNPNMFELHALFDSESGDLQVNTNFL
ncbi:hypothetical protein GOP47_0025178 [Adiantum capillus-veneris]|nr:hypothetical protein GOP47_0025178 [Adiantum capillus-veneris]